MAQIEGVAELSRKLKELASPKEQAAALREAVRKPMVEVMKRAQQNVSRVSPGKADLHRTYKGRLVSRGFASRSLRVRTKLSPDKQKATAVLGVLSEAFYALQFFELGTARIPARPWLKPAFDSLKDSAIDLIGQTMKKRIDRIAKRRLGGPSAS